MSVITPTQSQRITKAEVQREIERRERQDAVSAERRLGATALILFGAVLFLSSLGLIFLPL